MAYYRRRRYFRRRRRYGRRRFRRSYARRYVNASSRSSIRMKCVVTGSGTLKSGYGETLSDSAFRIIPLAAAISATNPVPVTASPLFSAYRNLYEEMKLIGMKVAISVTDQIGGSTLPSLQIYTAWDRRHGSTEADFTPAEIKDSASSNVATALNNNVAKLSRSIYASDLIEKAQWFDSSPVGASDASVASWVSATANPNMFSPAFYMVFGSPSLNAGSEVASVHFSISVTYYVAFRNPRYGGSGGSTKELPVKGSSLTATDDLRTQVPEGWLSVYDFLVNDLEYSPAFALQRVHDRIAAEQAGVMLDGPAGAAAEASEDVSAPAELGKRQRSNASAVALVPEPKKKNA